MIITRFIDFSHRIYESGQASIAARLGVSPDDPDFVSIRSRLARDNRMGLLEWFCRRRFVDGATMPQVFQVMDRIRDDRNTVREMPRPVNDLPSIGDFWSELAKARSRMSTRRTTNRLLPWQKGFLNPEDPNSGYWVHWVGKMPDKLEGLPVNDDRSAAWVTDRKVLEDLSSFDGADDFFARVKRHKDREQLLAAACSQMYLKPGSWDDLQKLVRKSGARPRFSSREGGVVILAADFQQTKVLASFSNWCILDEDIWRKTVKSELYVQWIVFLTDFSDKYSLVGTTTAMSPASGKFTHTETRLMNDEPIPTSDLRALVEERGAPTGFFEDTHKEVLRERLSEMRSWDGIAVAPILAAGIGEQDIARRKSRFTVKDLPSISGTLSSLMGAKTVAGLEQRRRDLIEDFRDRLPGPEFVSDFDGLAPETRAEVEDLVVRMHDNDYYSLIMSGRTKYDSLRALLDSLRMASQMSGTTD